MLRFGSIPLAILLVLLTTSASLVAQISTGLIRGTVTDQQGRVVPGVEVTMTNVATHLSRTDQTNDVGIYVFAGVSVGTFNLSVSKTGFKTEQQSGVQVQTTQTAVVDFHLTLGSVQEHVEVNSTEASINTTSAEVSGVVNEQEQTELPLNTRSFSAFVALSPGAVPSTINTAASAARSGLGAFVDGMRSFYNYFTIDGADISDPRFPGNEEGSGGGLGFSNDAISEFRVISQNGNPELGVNLGPHVVMTSKSGTSRLHGTAFEYFRNEALDARDFFDPAKKPPFKQNQFGFDLGGPVPHAANTFFFMNSEIRKQRRSISSVITVPTPTLLADVPDGPQHGNLRSLMQLLFPSIPAGVTPKVGAPTVSFPTSVLKNQDLYSGDGRIDHRFGSAHQFTGRYIFYRATEPFGSVVGTGIPSSDVSDYRFVQNFTVEDAWAVSQNVVDQMLFAFNRLHLEFQPRPVPSGVSSLGYSTSLLDPNGVPQMLFNGTGMNYIGPPIADPERDIDNIFQLGNKIVWLKGKHTLTFGADFERNQDNTSTPNNLRPEPIFLGFGPPFDNSQFGVTTGEFFTQTQNFFVDSSERGLRRAMIAGYFNDSFQIASRLTLTYGLRYQYIQPSSEAHNILTNLYQVDSAGNPIIGAQITDLSHVGIFPANQAGGFYVKDTSDVGPSLGLAWQPISKLVIRTGYALMYGRLPFTNITQTRLNPPFVIPTLSSRLQYGVANTQSEGQIPVLNIVDPNFRNPYGDFYNLSIEYQISPNVTFQTGYVGSQGHRLDRIHVHNYGPGYAGVRPNPTYGPIYTVSSDAISSYNSLQTQVAMRRSNGLEFQASYTFSKCLDESSGSTLVLGGGGDFLSNFPTDENDIRLNRGRCDFDFRQIGTGRVTYQLPFGKGATGIRAVASGWSLDGIVMLRSGQAYSLFTGTDTNGDGIAADRASIVVPLSALACHGCAETQWLNPAVVGTGVLNSTVAVSRRNILSGPKFGNLDFAVHKNTKLTERTDLQLRVEFFNLFNTAHLDIPSNNISASTFGRILDDVSNPRQLQLAVRFNF